MHDLLKSLRHRGWIVELADRPRPLLPPALQSRFPHVPSDAISFLSSLSVCRNRTDTVWLLTPAHFESPSPAAFRWDELERISLGAAEHDSALLSDVQAFWTHHLPFLYSVHSGYDFLAVRLYARGYGQVVHGYEPEFEEASPIAPSFTEFLEVFAIAAESSDPAYPFSVLLEENGGA